MSFKQEWISESQVCVDVLTLMVDRTLTQPDNAVLQGNPAGGLAPYTYAWTVDSGVLGTDFTNNTGNLTSQNLDLTFVNPGTYMFTLTVTDSDGGMVSQQVQVTYGNIPGSFSNSYSLSYSTIGTNQIS